ncbi:MAG: hypothetical protein ABIQ11_04210 [Saprospiraceae bacterium]
MLEFFKKNHLFNSLLLLPYAFVIRGVTIIFPGARIPGEILGTWASDFVASTHQWGMAEYIFSTFLIFIQAAIVNRLFIRQSMLGEINLFPGLSFILLTAMHPSFIGISSVMLANTTLMIALVYVFDILKKERQEETRFIAGWWLAVSALLYTPYFVLILFGLIAMSILKTLKIKDIFQFLTGFFSPFLIGWLLRVIITEDPTPAIFNVFEDFGIPSFGSNHGVSDLITISVFGLLLFFSLLGYTQIIARKNIHAQKKIDTLYALVFFGIPMALFCAILSVQFLMILFIPFSLFLAVLLRLVKHPAIAESIHFILFVAAILTQVFVLV